MALGSAEPCQNLGLRYDRAAAAAGQRGRKQVQMLGRYIHVRSISPDAHRSALEAVQLTGVVDHNVPLLGFAQRFH